MLTFRSVGRCCFVVDKKRSESYYCPFVGLVLRFIEPLSLAIVHWLLVYFLRPRTTGGGFEGVGA